MQDLELPDHEDSELMLTEAADVGATPEAEADSESGEGAGDGKVFRGAYTSKDPKEIIKRVREFEAHIQAAAKRFGVKVDHLRAIMAQESGGNPNADANPKKRVASAAGLMQVTGETWQQMRTLHADLKPYDFQTYKYNPRINCLFGAATLASKQSILTSSGVSKDSANFAQLTVAAYNGGEGVVKAALAHARAAGSKNPEADCLKEEHLSAAIKKFPSVYSYYLTGGGKGSNKSGSREEAIQLKFREISKYPSGVTKFLGAQREMGLSDGDKTETTQPTNTPTEATQQAEQPTEATQQAEQQTEQPQKPEQSDRKPDRFEYEPDRYYQYALTGSVGRGGDNKRADVIAVQNRLRFSALDTGPIDGAIGPLTLAAIHEFQRHFLKPDGLIEVGKKTAKELFSGKTSVESAEVNGEKIALENKEPVQPSKQTQQRESTQDKDDKDDEKDDEKDANLSSKGAAQLGRLVSTAARAAGGKKPDGKCYAAVKRHISNAGGYGNIRNIYADARFQPQGLARNFAEVVNAKGPESFGLEKLSVSNPYDAPEGSLVVVSAGSPGTRHPTAGDITVKGPGDRFFNDGEMRYGGRNAWPAKTGRVLGVYRVK